MPTKTNDRVLTSNEYLKAIAYAFLASPENSEEEGHLDKAFNIACERYGAISTEILEEVLEEDGNVRVEDDE